MTVDRVHEAAGPERTRKAPDAKPIGHETLDAVRRALAEFLLVPACLIAGFLLLAAGSYALDRGDVAWLESSRALLKRHIFSDPKATGDLLSTVAAGLITVTSITVSLLLIALQQSASALTHQVYDQFLRRRHNQFYFGFFVGLSLYALLTLATVGPLNPVFGATLTFALTVIALSLLIVMFYTTIDQMRPVSIIEAIHNHVLAAREAQTELVRRTRRVAQFDGPVRIDVKASRHGYVTRIDLAALDAAIARAGAEAEVELQVSIGSFVAFEDTLATVRAHAERDAATVGRAVERAIRLERQRDIATDPLNGIDELETIAWTSISSAQSDPDPGHLTIHSLRDLLARWSCQDDAAASDRTVAVVYSDNVLPRLIGAFESLAVAASESMQHQTCAAILRALTTMFDRLPPPQQRRVEDVILRTLSGLGDHVLTAELDAALADSCHTLEAFGRSATAAAVRAARSDLGRSVGRLGSRSTRVP